MVYWIEHIAVAGRAISGALAAAGATAFALLRRFGWPENQAAATGILIVLSLRLAAIRWKLSLPLFRKHNEPEH